MQHRRPADDCPLCSVWGVAWDPDNPATYNQQHVHAEKLWQAWNGGKGGSWPSDVVHEASKLGVVCNEKQARKHFQYHRIEQPAMSGILYRERLLGEAHLLPRRAQDIITALYRQRILTTEQLTEVFYASHYNGRSALTKCQEQLTALAARHFIYRCYPDEMMASKKDAPKNFSKQAMWALGKASVPFIEHTYGVKIWREHYAQMAKDISHIKLMHDLNANGVYTSLARYLRQQDYLVEIPGKGVTAASLRPDNWYGDKALALAFYNVGSRVEDEIRADGFATLSLHRNSWAGPGQGIPSCQMPFFYEYDHGTKDIVDVAAQLLAYHLLAQTRKAAERFPELDVPGYAVPVVMVFNSKNRIKLAHREFRKLAAEKKLHGRGVSIILIYEEDWNNNPFDTDICTLAWDDFGKTFDFLSLLWKSSQGLLASGSVLADATLKIDLKAARRITGAMATDVDTKREKQAKEKRLAEEKAQREARFKALRQQAPGTVEGPFKPPTE